MGWKPSVPRDQLAAELPDALRRQVPHRLHDLPPMSGDVTAAGSPEPAGRAAGTTASRGGGTTSPAKSAAAAPGRRPRRCHRTAISRRRRCRAATSSPWSAAAPRSPPPAALSSPPDDIVPYVRRPPEVTPGVPLSYATATVLDGHATGLLVQTREGRPVKVEGNPEHPAVARRRRHLRAGGAARPLRPVARPHAAPGRPAGELAAAARPCRGAARRAGGRRQRSRLPPRADLVAAHRTPAGAAAPAVAGRPGLLPLGHRAARRARRDAAGVRPPAGGAAAARRGGGGGGSRLGPPCRRTVPPAPRPGIRRAAPDPRAGGTDEPALRRRADADADRYRGGPRAARPALGAAAPRRRPPRGARRRRERPRPRRRAARLGAPPPPPTCGATPAAPWWSPARRPTPTPTPAWCAATRRSTAR